MAKKGSKYHGVFVVEGKKGLSYGIDYYHPITGRRVKKIVKSAVSLDDAHEARMIEIADAKRGLHTESYGVKGKSKPVLFSSMIDEYVKWAKENKGSGKTDDYRSRRMKAAFDGKLLTDVNPFLIEKYKMARAKEVCKNTVNKELLLGSQVFQKAIDWKKFDGANPFSKVDLFKVKKGKKPGALTPEDVRAIRDAISHPVKRDMVEFAFNAGWRISEIRRLKWTEVNKEAGTAWILDPKNGQSVEVELGEKANAIISRQTERGLFVFCKLNGEPFRSNMHAVIRSAAIKAGVELPKRKAWHIFRRTWASMMLQSGCDVETLRVLGNWKDFSMPLWYAEAAGREMKKKALNRLPDLDQVSQEGRNREEIPGGLRIVK